MGIYGPLLRYLQSFLSPRPFQVRIGHVTSPTFFSHRDTPQGSVLSPLLFILAIVGLTKLAPPTLHVSLCADDLAIYVSAKDPIQAQPLFQEFINRTTERSQNSGLHHTPTKCSSLIFVKHRSATISLHLCQPHSQRNHCSIPWTYMGRSPKLVCPHEPPPILLFSTAQHPGNVHSLLDYGCPIYGSVYPGVLTRLNPIQGTERGAGCLREQPHDQPSCRNP
jgi:hypothetical protein